MHISTMKGDTILDYAEFQLTPKRTRCELFISADGLMEKLASGFVKPFITHLRAAEAQVVKGNQVIRLESQGGFGKHDHHQKSDNAWFCKGTLERFVRFVSTPEIIERVKTIEDELTQLEQVRNALVNTFAQNPDMSAYGDSAFGQQNRDATHAMPKRFSTDREDSEGDASKRELLRAMEARLSALHQEQNMAFTRANAAGFDSNNIANLMTFAEDFGAERLNDACVQFLALSRKRTVPKGGQESTYSETPSDGSALASGHGTNLVSSDEAWLHGAKRKLDFGTNKVQTNNSAGLETRGISHVRKDLSQKPRSAIGPIAQTTEPSAGGTFIGHLQKMSQQVEDRPYEEFGWQMDAETNEPLSQGSQNDASGRQAAMDESLLQPQQHPCKNGDLLSSLAERSHSLPVLKVRTEGPHVWNASSVEAQSARNLTSEDEICKVTDNAKKYETTSGTETDRNHSQSTQGETPARRLSVQAAISLFESKKKDSNEPPFRKLSKQESRKSLTESGNSPSEKSVLRRWSAASPRSPEANSVQEKKNMDSGQEKRNMDNAGAERHQEPAFEKVHDGANKVSSSDRMVDSQPVRDDQARENFKKALSSLLHLDNTQHFGRPKEESDVVVQHVKQLLPIQQPSHTMPGSIVGSDSKDQFGLDRSSNPPMTKMDANISSKGEFEPSLTATPTIVKPPMRKPITEEKPDSLPAPSMTSLDYNRKIEQEDKDRRIMKAQVMKEILLKPSGSVSSRSKTSAQVLVPIPVPVPVEQNVGPVAPVVHKPDQVFDKKAEALKIKVPDNDRQSGKTSSYGKGSVQRKATSGKESSTNVLASSVDFHMQALVKMVEHQYTNLSLNGVSTSNEQRGEQRGRFYDQYSKLRDAKLRGEHPAKRAEREAKLKSMQETLERRKAEMETRPVQFSKKKAREARVADSGSEKAGLTAAVVDQKDLKDEEDDTDQEEFSLKSQGQALDYSNPTSPSSTPRSSKNQSSSLKSRAPVKIIPAVPKSSTITRNPTRPFISSPRPSFKSPGATPSQGNTTSINNSSGDTIAAKTVLNMKDMAKSSLMRTTASARVHPRSNGSTNDVVTLDEDANNATTLANPEKKELRNSSLTRKNVASIAVSKSLLSDAGMLQGSPKDQQEGATDTMADSKASLGLGTTQEVKPFLRKGRGIGPGAGVGIMKQKASAALADTSKSSDDDTSADNKQDGASLNPEDITSTTENSTDVHETEETEKVCKIKEQVALDTSCTAMSPTANDDLTSPSSRPSSGGPTDSGEVEALDYLPESAAEIDKSCPTIISLDEEHHEGASPGVTNSASQGSFSQALNNKQKEGTFILSDLFSQRNPESLPHNAGFVTSSISFREVSLPHGHIGSPFPASASHTYSSLLQRGAVSSRFSPPRANALDLPTASPALWSASQASKYIPEPDMIHSNRQINGQKPTSMLPLPPKEPSKGFKRLLHFGRKSRPSETTTTDCVSVSTTSEGDDDGDEVREIGSQLSDELLRKIRMQKRGFEYGNQGDHYGFADQDTPQFFGSAIPPPPANFKLREEHLSGGNLIKAPRSFFSLSSFRSKGSEGKSR